MSSPWDLIIPNDKNSVKVKQATKSGFILCARGGLADLGYPTSKTRRGRVQENGQICPTIMAGEPNIYKIE